MNNTDLNQLMATPLSMAVAAIALVVLTALTMRAVVSRERAMIGGRRRDSGAEVVYMSHWRNRSSA